MPAENTPSHKTVPAPNLLPTSPADFTGRAAELRAARKQPAAAVLNLIGPDGAGKTALALLLARELAPRYPNGQIFVDFQERAQSLTPAVVMAQVIRAYHPMVELPDEEIDVRAVYQEVLHSRRVLFLFDNVSDPEQLSPLLPPAGCTLLLTSQQQCSLPGLRRLVVGGLLPEDASALLLQWAPRIGRHAAELAELCGYFPLALRLAGGALRQMKDLDPPNFVDRLQAEQWRQDKLDEIDAALMLSYDLLTVERQRQWRDLAVFPADFDRPAAAAVLALDDRRIRQALGDALRYGLLTYDHRLDRFRMHHLVRKAAIERQPASQFAETRQRHAMYYLYILELIDKQCQQAGEGTIRGLRRFDLECSNILAGQAWVAMNMDEDKSAAGLASAYATAGVHVLPLRQTLPDRLAWLERGQRAAHQLGDREAEALHLGRLGSIHRHRDEPRWAIDYYERSLRLARENGDSRGEEQALGKLGLAYADLGQVEQAITYYQQQLQLALDLGDRQAEAQTSWNLGLAYEELGDLAKAIEAMEVCLKFERETGHPDAEPDAAVVSQLRTRLGSSGTTR
jgi:tetratricopeptide (TPR) repeat protein